MVKTVILGDEYDDGLKEKLIDYLRNIGAVPLSSDWSIVGSQELSELSVSVDGQILDISAETFIGLSISGPDKLVDKIYSTVLS